MEALENIRPVLVHDWLTGMRGGEKCLEPFCRLWPGAPLYTLLHSPGKVSTEIERRKPRTSFLQLLPRVERYYRYLLPLMPLAANWRLPECELVLSFSHCVAKAALPQAGVPHICYCFTPMRYAWHLRNAYFHQGVLGRWKRLAAAPLLARLREWDRATAERVTHFIAISRTVQQRIRECYGRASVVIHPPVNTDFYTPAAEPREDFYLCVSAMAPYKRIDLAVQACNRLQRRLIVIGAGQDEARIRSLAGPTVQVLGWQPDVVIRDHLRRCRALLFPGEEDLGIVPLEALACGTPVLAFNRGGATETITGVGSFFDEQNVECLVQAIEQLECDEQAFDPAAARKRAMQFGTERYLREMSDYLSGVLGLQTKTPLAA
jgi:glycosyltransferase involved in cell wall biosynthesis